MNLGIRCAAKVWENVEYGLPSEPGAALQYLYNYWEWTRTFADPIENEVRAQEKGKEDE